MPEIVDDVLAEPEIARGIKNSGLDPGHRAAARDAFDSAFHEIVRVDYLTVGDTAQLLSSWRR